MDRMGDVDATVLLKGQTILVLEDEYFQAKEICRRLTEAGAVVLDPFPTVGDGCAAIEGGRHLDAALLDVELRGERVYALANALRVRRIPLVFMTGYVRAALPLAFRDVPICDKPVDFGEVARHLAARVDRP